MKKKNIIFVTFFILIVLVVAFFITRKIIEKVTKDITEREVKRITQEEIGKVTDKEIDKITEDIVKQRTEEITRQVLEGDAGEIKCNRTSKQREFTKSPYYDGPLIDDHVHMPVASKIVSTVAMQSGFEDMPYEGDIPIDSITCIFDSEGITKAFEFYLMPNAALSLSVRSAKNAKERHKEKIVPFFMPPPITSLHPSAADVADTIRSNKGLFKGIGELAIYHYPSSVQPNDPYFLELYKIANEQNLIVMIHPSHDQQQAVEEIIKTYPNIKFLFHGEEWVVDILGKYSNIYFSIDATENHLYGFDPRHINKKPTKEEWLDYFRKNFDIVLDNAVTKWKTTIEKYPDRFLWGTDRWYSWHFDAEVGGLIGEFSRSFIGQLDPAVQEKFAYKNAEKIIQGG